jgi:hypothetical protein
MDMFSIAPIQFRERVNEAFERAIKRKNSEYLIQEQLRNEPIVTGVFNGLQKVLLTDPNKWKELQNEKVYKEVDKEWQIKDRLVRGEREKDLNDFHLGQIYYQKLFVEQKMKRSLMKYSKR